jgi:hypothetical protein
MGQRTKGASDTKDGVEELDLEKAVLLLLEECRMVLPGIQALFGFQLVAVFSQRFGQLSPGAQRLHLLSLSLVAAAIVLIMTPAAYHRQTDPRQARGDFIDLSTRLLLWSMVPLSLAICLDFYVVAQVIVPASWASALGAALLTLVVVFWWVLPRWRGLATMVAGRSRSLNDPTRHRRHAS